MDSGTAKSAPPCNRNPHGWCSSRCKRTRKISDPGFIAKIPRQYVALLYTPGLANPQPPSNPCSLSQHSELQQYVWPTFTDRVHAPDVRPVDLCYLCRPGRLPSTSTNRHQDSAGSLPRTPPPPFFGPRCSFLTLGPKLDPPLFFFCL